MFSRDVVIKGGQTKAMLESAIGRAVTDEEHADFVARLRLGYETWADREAEMQATRLRQRQK